MERAANNYLKEQDAERVDIDRLTNFIDTPLACSQVLRNQFVLALLELLNLHQALQEVGWAVLDLVRNNYIRRFLHLRRGAKVHKLNLLDFFLLIIKSNENVLSAQIAVDDSLVVEELQEIANFSYDFGNVAQSFLLNNKIVES